MKERTKKSLPDCTVDDVFMEGLTHLLCDKHNIERISANPIQYYTEQIIDSMTEISQAFNVLRSKYGIQFCDVSVRDSESRKLQVYCGIDELSKALGCVADTEDQEFSGLTKQFSYEYCNFIQLAERNSTEFQKAFSGPSRYYYTTYDRVYDEDGNRKS